MFVFPMLGKSSRFFDLGYNVPKFQRPLNNSTVFNYVIRSFYRYFHSDSFLFLCRSDFDSAEFITQEIRKLGLQNYQIMLFDVETEGQADTVYQGMEGMPDNEELYIFNIDTFRPGFVKPDKFQLGDGYLETFIADGDNWSFIVPGPNQTVLRTVEKERVSNLCCSGLYYFRNKILFEESFLHYKVNRMYLNGELYVAPLYNYLISQGRDIRYNIINNESVIPCGTPAEYEKLSALNIK